MSEVIFENLPKRIEIREVGPREGVQSEKVIPSTEEKIAFINGLMKTGITRIQVGSYVHPKYVPQMADIEDVVAGIDRPDGVEIAVLVPNVKGAERAMKAHAHEWNLMFSVSESHSKANSGASMMDVLQRMDVLVDMAKEAGAYVTGAMGTSLGCPFEGRIPRERLYMVVETYLKMGVTRIGISDTAGMADPLLVYDTCHDLHTRYPEVQFKLHLHNTRGMGLANVIAGMQAGITSFDASVGGLGGCPFVPGAAGNIPTEDLVHMLHMMGIDTGIQIPKVLEMSKRASEIFQHPINSFISKAGTSEDLHDFALARRAEKEAARAAAAKETEKH